MQYRIAVIYIALQQLIPIFSYTAYPIIIVYSRGSRSCSFIIERMEAIMNQNININASPQFTPPEIVTPEMVHWYCREARQLQSKAFHALMMDVGRGMIKGFRLLIQGYSQIQFSTASIQIERKRKKSRILRMSLSPWLTDNLNMSHSARLHL